MAFRRKKRSISPYARTRSIPKRRVSKRRQPGKTRSTFTEAKNKASDRRKIKAAKRTRGILGKIKRPILLILGGIIILYITNALFISNNLTIQNIQIKEDNIILMEHPIEALLSDLKGSNLLLLNADNYEPYLRDKYPQYETLKIHKNLPDTLLVTLKTYPVVAKLTVEVPEGEDQEFLISSAGRTTSYEEVVTVNPETLRQIIIESDQSLGSGTEIISQDHLAFILEAMQNFEDRFGMEVLHARYFDIEREVHLWTERNFYVWLDITVDLDEQLNKLKKGLPRLNIYEENLEYIDLRIGGINGEKIIFKTH